MTLLKKYMRKYSGMLHDQKKGEWLIHELQIAFIRDSTIIQIEKPS